MRVHVCVCVCIALKRAKPSRTTKKQCIIKIQEPNHIVCVRVYNNSWNRNKNKKENDKKHWNEKKIAALGTATKIELKSQTKKCWIFSTKKQNTNIIFYSYDFIMCRSYDFQCTHFCLCGVQVCMAHKHKNQTLPKKTWYKVHIPKLDRFNLIEMNVENNRRKNKQDSA